MESPIKESLKMLLSGLPLPAELITACINSIMTGSASPAQVGGFLLALRQFTVNDIYYSAQEMVKHSIPCSLEDVMHAIDIVGTGGDALDTFNVSTAAGFIVAASGVPVAKHGNRSSSGRCGAADLVEALGVNLHTDPNKIAGFVKQCNFGFLFAQKFHPAMAKVAPIRKELGVRTIFNVLGPLANPAQPKYMLAGVGDISIAKLYAEALQMAGFKRAWVVHSHEGLDEITPSGTTFVWEVDGDKPIAHFSIHPSDFGLQVHPIEAVAGSHPAENVATFRRVLANETSPVMDFVLMNAAAALKIVGRVESLIEGVKLARETIESGRAKELVETYVNLTNA